MKSGSRAETCHDKSLVSKTDKIKNGIIYHIDCHSRKKRTLKSEGDTDTSQSNVNKKKQQISESPGKFTRDSSTGIQHKSRTHKDYIAVVLVSVLALLRNEVLT
jgi:hypothetical protein